MRSGEVRHGQVHGGDLLKLNALKEQRKKRGEGTNAPTEKQIRSCGLNTSVTTQQLVG